MTAYRLKHYDFSNVFVCGRSPSQSGRPRLEFTTELRFAKTFDTAEEASAYIRGCQSAHVYEPVRVPIDELLAWVASHNMVSPHIDDNDVVFGVEATRDGALLPFVIWERVSTLSEARDALGY